MALPSDYANLQFWAKADSETYADNAAVDQATDRSGNARHFTNTGSARPTFKTAIVNGLPVYRFDGVDDLLANATAISSFLAAGAGTIYSFVRASAISVSGFTYAAHPLFGDTGGFTATGFRVSGGNKFAGAYTFDGADKEATKAASQDIWYLLCWLHSGGTIYCGLDDLATASMASVAAGNTTDLTGTARIARSGLGGGSAFFTGDLAEIAVYNVAHDEATRASLQQYFSFKYRISPLLEAQRNNASRRLRLIGRPIPMVNCRSRSLIVVPDLATALRMAA